MYRGTYRANLDGSDAPRRIGEPTPPTWGNKLFLGNGRVYWVTNANEVVSTTLDGSHSIGHYRASTELIGPVVADGSIHFFEEDHPGSVEYTLVSLPLEIH